MPAIVDWYEQRGVIPWLAIPDRLLAVPPRAVAVSAEPGAGAGPAPPTSSYASPDDGDRATVTDAPDGTRWVGISVPGGTDGADEESAARRYEAVLAAGVQLGATRGYLVVTENDAVAAGLAHRLAFRLHHDRRYFDARQGGWDTV